MNNIRSLLFLLLVFPILLFSKEHGLKYFGQTSSYSISSVVLDSVPNLKSTANHSSVIESLTGELMLTSSSKYDRNIGVGARVNIVPINYLTVGCIILIYWGSNETYPFDNPWGYIVNPRIGRKYYGYGTLAYIAPEIGTRYSFSGSMLELFLSYGQATIRTNQPLNGKNPATVDMSCLCPGMGIKFNIGLLKIGFQYRYIIMEPLSMPAMHISIGN